MSDTDMDYEYLWFQAIQKAQLKAKLMYPPGAKRDSACQELADRFYREYITPPSHTTTPMSRTPKEDIVEDHFVKEFKKAFPQGQIHKYEIRRSEPDRICLLPGGVTVFIELKRPGKELREEQERAARRLGDLGFDCYWANTKELVDTVIAEMIEKYGTQGGCTECGGAIMPLRSLNLKRCYDCGHETPWRLKENQKPMICAQR